MPASGIGSNPSSSKLSTPGKLRVRLPPISATALDSVRQGTVSSCRHARAMAKSRSGSMARLIPRFSGSVEPETLNDINELIQARIGGGISRRQVVKRATPIGICAPVVGVRLHATSDMAFGQPSMGRDRTIARMQVEGTKEVTGPTAPAGTPVEGGILVASSISEPDTLNPWVTALVTAS